MLISYPLGYVTQLLYVHFLLFVTVSLNMGKFLFFLIESSAFRTKAVSRVMLFLQLNWLFRLHFFTQVAIPVVPTIRVIVTFTKYEELQPVDEFATPPSSPTAAAGRESPSGAQSSSSSSWFQWIKAPYQRPSSSSTVSSSRIEILEDPFTIPQDYTWVTAEAKKKKIQEKNRTRKGRNRRD